MFNTGYKGHRAQDNKGVISPQAKFIQTDYPIPTITSWSVSGLDDTAIDTAGGQTILVNGTGFAAGCSVIINGVTVSPVTVVSPTQISFTAPAIAGGTYALVVYNSTGGGAILVPGVVYSAIPAWNTAAGSIGSYYETQAISSTVSASSNSALTYTLASGSLPAGATLSSGGVITGTAPVTSGSTTYTFAVTATDAELQDVTRTFTLTVNTDVLTWVTPSSGATLTATGTVSQSLSATDGAGYAVSYSANTLPAGLTLSGSTISGTPTVEGTSSTTLTATAATTGRSATNTITWIVTLTDQYFKYITTLLSANTSVVNAPSFINDNSLSNNQLTVVGDTRAQTVNPYQPGYYSTYFDGSSYLTIPTGTGATQYGSIANSLITIEFWLMTTNIQAITAYISGIFGQFPALAQNGRYAIETVGTSSTSTQIIRFYYTTGTGTAVNLDTTATIAQNTWNHVAVTIDSTTPASSTIKIYINGVAQTFTAQNLSTHTSDPGNQWQLGAANDGNQALTGYISNFRFTRGYLVYTGNFTPSTTPLLAPQGTRLLTCSNNRFTDLGPVNTTLGVSGSPKISSANPFSTVLQANTPYYGGYLDGTGDYLTLTSATLLQKSWWQTNTTIEYWIYPTAFTQDSGGASVVVGNMNPATGGNYWSFGPISNGTVKFYYYTGIGQSVTTSSTIPLNQWSHLAFVYNGLTLTIYINGVSSATGTISGTPQSDAATPLTIGSANNTAQAGVISNLRITQGVAVYNANFIPDTTTLATTTTVPATQNWSIAFDGSSRLSIPNNAVFDFGTGDFTVEFWMNCPSWTSGGGAIIGKKSGDSANGWQIYRDGNQTSKIDARLGQQNNFFTTSTPTNGVWQHWALVRSGTNVYWFLNGVLDASTTSSANISDSASLNMAYADTWGVSGTILLSNVRIVKGQALYTGTFTPSTTALTATAVGSTGTGAAASITGTVSLLTCQNNSFQDNSPNSLTFVASGTPRVSSSSPFVSKNGIAGSSYSAYFDGTGDYIDCGTTAAVTAFSGSDFTWEAWVCPTGWPQNFGGYYNMTVMGTMPNSGTSGFELTLTGSATSISGVYVAFKSVSGFNSSYNMYLNTWYHVAVTKSGSTVRVFVNGALIGTGTYSTWTDATPLTIGSLPASSYRNYFTGYISNLRIVKGQALYTANFTPATTPLTTTSQGATASNVSLLTCKSTTIVDSSTNAFTLTANGDVKAQTFNPYGGNTHLLACQNSTFTDNSLVANTITVTGDAKPVPQSPFTPVYYSGYFNGSTDYLTVPDNSAWAFSGDFTIECWAYPTTINTNNAVLSQWGSVGNSNFIFKYLSASNRLQFVTNDITTTGSTTAVTANAWNHLAVTRQGSTIRLFVNGVLDATTGTKSGTFADSTNPLQIGGQNGASEIPTGYISNVRIVNGQALYTANFTPSTTPLTAISGTSLLTCQSPYFTDNSTNVFAITTTGSPKIAAVAPFTQPTGYSTSAITTYGSGYFNNTGSSNSAWITGPTLPTFGTLDHTIEFWIYNDGSMQTYSNPWTYYGAATQQATNNYYISVNPNNTSVGLGGGGAWLLSGLSTTAPPINTWAHIAVTRQGTTFRLFVNGVLGATVTGISGSITAPAGPMYIATYNASAANGVYVKGYITDFRIVLGTALYTSTFAPPVAPLTTVANTQLLTLQTRGSHNNSVFQDQSSYANLITRYGNVTNGTFSPYGSTYSNYFNGSSDYLTTTNAANVTSGDFTVECWVWVNAAQSGNYGGIFSTRDSSNSYGIAINILNTGYWDFGNYPGGGYTSTAVTYNQWVHLAMVRSGSGANNIKCFVNGTLVGSFTGTASTSTNSGLAIIGRYYVNGTSQYFLNGYVSNLRYVVGQALYSANFTPSTSPLTAIPGTTLLTCQSPRFLDNSQYNATVTPNGLPTTQKFSPFSGVNPATYYSGYFDGSGDYVSLPAGTGISLGTSDFTIEAWVYPTARVTNGAYIIAQSSYSVGTDFLFYILNNGTLQFYALNTTSSFNFSSTQVIPLNTWSHVAVVRSGSSYKLYINGVNDGSITNSSSITNSYTPTTIGNSTNNTGSVYFPGYISNLRVVRGTAVYTTNFTPPTSPLTAITGTQLLTCQNNTFIDNSTNYYTLTASGDAKPLTFAPPFNTSLNYGVYFDGSGDYLSFTNTAATNFGTGDFTVEMWVFPTALSQYNMLFAAGGANHYFALKWGATSSVFGLNAYNGTDLTSSTLTTAINQWVHVAFVRSSGTLYFYINGVASGSGAFSGQFGSSTGTATIGFNASYAGQYYMNGSISNLRMVKGQALYTGAFTPGTSNLTTTSQGATAANVSLLTCQSPYIIDNSNNKFAVTVVGDTKVVAQSPFANTNPSPVAYSGSLLGGSMYFDGAQDFIYVPSTGSAFTYYGDFTIEFWVYPTSGAVSTYNPTFFTNNANGDWATSNVGIRMHYSNAIFGSGGGFTTLTYTNSLTQNTWNHVALVRSGSTITMYKNGVPNGAVSYGAQLGFNTCWPALATSDLAGTGGREFAQGYFSDWRITNGKALYTGAFYPGTAPATPVYTLGTTTYPSNLLVSGTAGGIIDASRVSNLETVGDAKITQFSPYSGTYYSVLFNGSSDYLTAPNSTAYVLSGDFTLECWIYNSSVVSGESHIFGKRASNATYTQIIFGLNVSSGTNRMFMIGSTNGTSWNIAATTGATVVPINQWNHLAVVRSGTSLKGYVNGVADPSLSFTASGAFFTNTDAVTIGTSATSPTAYFPGNISNFRFVNGQALYTANFTPATSPLTTTSQGISTGTVSLLTCQSNRFVDNSSNAFAITAAGTPKVQTRNPFQVNTGTSYYFDGTGDYLAGTNNLQNYSLPGDFTIEYWIYLNNLSAQYTVIDFRGAQYNVGFTDYITTNGKINLFQESGSTYLTTTGSLVAGQWTHVAYVRSGSTIKIYINGVADATTATNSTNWAVPSSKYNIGANKDAGGPLNGYLADLRVTRGYARYTTTFTPSATPTIIL